MSDIFGGEEIDLEAEQAQRQIREEDIPDQPIEAEEAEAVEVEKEPVGKDSTVPLSALNESRAQLRQTQAELAQMREQMQRFEDMRRQLEEFRQRQQQASAEDEFNTDPLGTIQKQIKSLDERLSRSTEEERTSAQMAQQEQQIFQAIASQVNEFKKTAPDYDSALAHVLDARKNELISMGIPDYEVQQRIAAEAQEIAVNALRSGRNPGQVVYELAKFRGYEGKKTSQKLATVEKGQRASSSLSNASGSAPDSGFSLAEIDSMSDEEFDAFWDKEMKPRRH